MTDRENPIWLWVREGQISEPDNAIADHHADLILAARS